MSVFRKSSKASQQSDNISEPVIVEPKIPELELSHLTPDEIAVIQHVLQKQKLFEKQTENKRIMIENQIRQHETRINNNMKKHLDLRLCRLCFNEKFSDGIGRVCHGCRRRVCYYCGSFYKPIESFSVEVKAKWRCRLCSLKREFLCMTGNWYHGDKARPVIDAKTFESTEVLSDKEKSTEPNNKKKSCAFHSSGVKSDTETLDPYTQGNRRKQFYHRRPSRRQGEESIEIRYDPHIDDPRRRKRSYGRRRRRPGVISSSKNQQKVEIARESSDTDGEAFHGRYSRRYNDSNRYSRPKEMYNSQNYSPDSGLELTSSDYHYQQHQHHQLLHQQQQVHQQQQYQVHHQQHRQQQLLEQQQHQETTQQQLQHHHNPSLWHRRRTRSTELEESEEPPQIPSIRIEKGSEKLSPMGELKEVEYVILRKDVNDRSVRTRGFGMEIMSGKMRPDGTLVTVVTRVVAGGPAHVHGNLKSGDQILEWNGENLLDKTFEEACSILSKECDILNILVLRSRHHSRHNSVDRNRPMSLVDTEITARRKTISRSLRNQVNTDQYRRIFHVDSSNPRRKISSATTSPVTSPVTRQSPVPGSTTPPVGSTSPPNGTATTNLLTVAEQANADNVDIKMPVTGEIRLSVLYKMHDRELVVHTQEAKGIQVRHTSGDPQLPNPYIKIDMLPHRRESIRQRTATVDASLCPVWNKVFVYSNIDESNISSLGLEFTMWDDIPKRSNTFMGEVQLDLADCDLTGRSQWYNLVDHDENNGPLPKTSPAEVRKTSPCFTRGIPSMPAHDKVKELWENGYLTLRSQGNRSGSDTSICSARSADDHWPHDRQFTSATGTMPSPTVIKQLTGARPKIKVLGADIVHDAHGLDIGCLFRPRSSTLPISSLRRSASDRQPSVKNQTKAILRATNSDASLNIQHKSKGIFRRCASFRRADSTSSDRSRDSITSIGSTDSENFIKLLTQNFEDESTIPEEEEPTGTPEGPGQAKLQNNGMRVCGYIMLDMTVSKGYLEVLIIKAHGLNSPQSEPIDTYVKTYLRDFKKKLQKKKTRVVKKSTNPVYMQKLTYSACDIDRRILQVGVWKKGSGIESNKQLGETRIHLDKCSLDHMEHTKAWYTLYPSLAFARSDSVESQASI